MANHDILGNSVGKVAITRTNGATFRQGECFKILGTATGVFGHSYLICERNGLRYAFQSEEVQLDCEKLNSGAACSSCWLV